IAAARGKPEIFEKFRKSIARRTRGFEAPEACIQCVEAAVNLPFDDGLKRERELFMQLMTGDQSKAQRYFFFAEREAAKIPDVPKETPIIDVEQVAVLGAGTMGGGIAMNFLNAGYPVTLIEHSQEALDRGLGVIRKNYENTAAKGRISQDDVEKRMALITPSLSLTDARDADMVIEAVFENMDIKKDVFARLDQVCKSGAILATNTSTLDVNEIAEATNRPQDVIGAHFFSPANVMKLLELVRGEKTSDTTIATSMSIAKKIAKVPALVGVCYGFVGNRMLHQRGREAEKLMYEGAKLQDIDRVLFDFGFPMGPFAMGDLAGLDVGWRIRKETGAKSPVADRLCEMGRFGQKTGAGYFKYEAGNRTPVPDPEVEQIIKEEAEKLGIQQREIDEAEILDRLVLPMINEGAKILDEGIAIRASDIDVIWVYGYGWPVYRGGPMFYADLRGVGAIRDRMLEFKDRFGGDAWEPAALLKKLADDGKSFTGQ
ncbi:MAG: 3-hydroxyacyl-CoA dehydrogenase, partial [Minwuiales bacterium]|nr:3-hydroxyacyl-CoA dehydrogenase [Minwuiales bacterium]